MANGMPSMNSAGMGELFARLRFVLIALLIYRIGTHIPVPGIDPEQLASLFDQNQGTILGLANVFSGGALHQSGIRPAAKALFAGFSTELGWEFFAGFWSVFFDG